MNFVAKGHLNTTPLGRGPRGVAKSANEPVAAPALQSETNISRASFATIAAGRPLLDRFSPRYLRDNGIYLYENALGEVHAAIASEEQLAFVDTVEWTLQCKVVREFANVGRYSGGTQSRHWARGDANASELSPSTVMRADSDEDTVETLRDLASGAPVVRAVNEIIELALERRATDIHLEPVRDGIRIRIRVDGILTTVRTFAPELARPIVSRIKILAALNIAERRLPQDGRSHIRVGNYDADVRIATMPTAFGEAAILRLLQREKGVKALSEVGFSPRDFDVFSRALKAPHGMIVVTGPTGSGKTTTLAAALGAINDDTRKILNDRRSDRN